MLFGWCQTMSVYLVSCLDRSVCGLLQQYCFGSDVACYVLLFHAHTFFWYCQGVLQASWHPADYYATTVTACLCWDVCSVMCKMLIPVCCFKSMSLSAARPCGRCSSFHCFCRWCTYIHDTDCLWSVRKHTSLIIITRLNVARPDIDWQRWTAVSRLLACLMFEWSFTATAEAPV